MPTLASPFTPESPENLLPASFIGWLGLIVLAYWACGMPGWHSKDAGLAFVVLGWTLAIADALFGFFGRPFVVHCMSSMTPKWHLAHDCWLGLLPLILPALLVIPAGIVEFSRCSGRSLRAHKWLIVGSGIATFNFLFILAVAVLMYFT
jgi:hypothetical protein